MKLSHLFNKLIYWFSYIMRRLLIALLLGLRPLLGPACCRFGVSCTDFAVLKLQEEPLCRAVWEIIKRLTRCHPFYKFSE